MSINAQTISAPAVVKELPFWVAVEPLDRLERGASSAIAQALSPDRPARIGLLELATSRPQDEVRWLSLRCLGYIGQFQDIVRALGDVAFKLKWSDRYIPELCEAASRDSETAAAIRLALEKQYPQQAADLYRMLWGYSNADLEAGEDANLVKALDDDTLAVRVLAIWNLKDITGKSGYQPEQTPAKRKLAIGRWQQRLKAKEIRVKDSTEKAEAGVNEKPLPPN